MSSEQPPTRRPPFAGDQGIARALVVAQFGLLALVVLLPAGVDWPVSKAVRSVAFGAEALGLLIMAVAATSLGRGLTALPLPNDKAQLRTGGLYRFARHPIYSGLILFAVADAASSGSAVRATVCALLCVLLTLKARWEERRLAERFPGYREYADRTPRFLPLPWRRH